VKQVVQNLRNGEVTVIDVPPPRLGSGGALVATKASVISAGTERQKIELGKKGLLGKARARPELAQKVIESVRREGLRETYSTVMLRLDEPSPLGYSACGQVLSVASDCAGVQAGDLVACAGQDFASHAEVNFIPKHLLAKVPDNVAPAEAAFATIGAIAMQGIRQADVRLGDRVVVLGLGLVGLLAVQLARAAGGRVLGLDLDLFVCRLAEELGAEQGALTSDPVEALTETFTAGMGVDSVIVTASTPSNEPIELAGRLCRDRGRVVVLGLVGTAFPRELYYLKELEVRLSRAYGPGSYDPAYELHGHDYPVGHVRWTEQRHLEEFLRLVGAGTVNVDALTTHRFPLERAPEAYAVVSGEVHTGRRPVGVVLEYSNGGSSLKDGRTVVVTPRRHPASDRVRVAVIGAGNFATRVLLPVLRDDERVELTGVATASGLRAQQAASRFDFAYATSEAEELIEDPDTDAMIIATRHDSHATLAAAALRSGKAVFCEKPLAVSWEQLEDVAAAYAETRAPLLVGFNRRFSPLTQAAIAALPNSVPRSVVCRVNAGPVPALHWTHDAVLGGGRIIGEFCHFLDLACYLAGGRPTRVTAEALGSGAPPALNDSVVAQVAFENGSIASLQYLANGDTRASRERVEIFSGGVVALIDDFRRLELVRAGRKRGRRRGRIERGHREELAAFVDLATGSETDVSTPSDAFWSSALTLQVIASLTRGGPVPVKLPIALRGRGSDYPQEGDRDA
jgi:predicted dehydrogenase/NADPH:quinone reductase-like Zn-dependent oxidoreductase